MANQLSELPWSIDTPNASALYTAHMKIRHLEFVGYASASDFCEVQDESGNLVAILQGTPDLAPVKTYKVGWITGILVPITAVFGVNAGNPNLVSGLLLVYLE